VILEAMQMENEIKSPQAGKVKSVLVEKGKAVEKGELLLLLE
jgi:biotin carboxyl carrier protein